MAEVRVTTPGTSGNIVPDEMFFYLNVFMLYIVGNLMSVVGIVTNVINVVVFYKQGLRDSVTVTFIALSLWGLGICVLSFLSVICFFIEKQAPIPTVNMLAVRYVYLVYIRGCMYALSTVLTMYLSVERCICIIIPFRVRGIFTKSRSIVTNIIIAVYCSVIFSPTWATQGLQWGFDPKFNRTRLGLWLAPGRREILLFNATFTGAVLPTIAQVVITVSAVFMISVIKTSAKFRQKALGVPSENKEDYQSLKSPVSESTLSLNIKDNFMSSKDSKLTKIVVLVAIIFFICNIPMLVTTFIGSSLPELEIGRGYNNLYNLLVILVYDFVLINSSVNILVYYSVSSRYKEVFTSLFSRNKTLTQL